MSDGGGTFDLQPGRLLAGRYAIESLIARGAMGAVYRARDESGDAVAVKQLVDLGQSARFEIEARLLGRLRHPRVVRVLDSFEDGGDSYLVMELVSGTDLGTVLIEHGAPGLAVDEATRYTLEICEALHYVHEQGIVHRDVKPRNIVLADKGAVLVDFGIARELDTGDPGTRGVGTPQFMAPEVLVGENVSPRSDVYALAATLWTLVTATPPTYSDSTRLAEVVPGVTAELERVLRQALELRPERRLSSVAALASALGSPIEAIGGESLAVSVAGPAEEPRLLEGIARTAAGVLDAAAASIALVDEVTGELVYQAAWGAGADEIVGVRLPRGQGIAGAVAADGEGTAVPDCRSDERFAARIAEGTGYVPHTMLVTPLERGPDVIGALSVIDRRDGNPYGPADLERANLFADLAVTALASRAPRGADRP